MPKIYRLSNPRNVFMDVTDGKMYAIVGGKEFLLKSKSIGTKCFAYYGEYEFDLLNIALEALNIQLYASDTVTFKITKSNFISPTSIRINKTPAVSQQEMGDMVLWKCDAKASSSNSRFLEKISKDAVYQVLKLSNFSCIYCSSELSPTDWHLDHYIPRAKKGKNTIDNLVPSCSKCNLMKGALKCEEFVSMCYRISMNNKIATSHFNKRFEAFDEYAQGKLAESPDGFELSYSSTWELYRFLEFDRRN